MEDIRNKEITIKINEDEDSFEAIKRYMKRKKFNYFEEPRKAGLIFQGWYNNKYNCLWIQSRETDLTGSKVTFILSGNM